jgi:hypothetical protein
VSIGRSSSAVTLLRAVGRGPRGDDEQFVVVGEFRHRLARHHDRRLAAHVAR